MDADVREEGEIDNFISTQSYNFNKEDDNYINATTLT